MFYSKNFNLITVSQLSSNHQLTSAKVHKCAPGGTTVRPPHRGKIKIPQKYLFTKIYPNLGHLYLKEAELRGVLVNYILIQVGLF